MTYRKRRRRRKVRRKQQGGSNQSAIIARRFSHGKGIFGNRLQYGYGLRNKYGIAPRKSFYIHK